MSFLGENIKHKKARVLDYISVLYFRLLFDLEKVTSLDFNFSMSQMEMTVPISWYTFLPYTKGVAIRINEMMFVNSFELFGRQMFYKYKLLIKYLY